MEYLKNVVVEYLSIHDATKKQVTPFHPFLMGVTPRLLQTLQRVLATLLQFSPEEERNIDEAQSDVFMGLFATPSPIEIKPIISPSDS